MPRISIATAGRARPVPAPDGMEGGEGTLAYFDGPHDPVHLHLHRLARDAGLRMTPHGVDRLAYVWQGAVEAGGRLLDEGSTLIVGRGGTLDMTARDDSILLLFAPGKEARPERPHGGGGPVRLLLPRALVPRVPDRTGSGTTGALHADGRSAPSPLWFNENSLAGRAEAPTDAEALRGTHAHPEDEIIFITGGQVRLGRRLYGPGTALAIAAHTLYGFSPGPEGVSFVTFRPAPADSIRFATGGGYAESTYFRGVGPIAYLEPVAG
ncbi:MAG: hypothetical protein QM690_09740 [Sphingobium sp.]